MAGKAAEQPRALRRCRGFPRAEDLAGVVERKNKGLHSEVVAAHLSQVLEAVAEEIGIGLQQPVGSFQAAVLLDHAEENRWRVLSLAHDSAVQIVHRLIETPFWRSVVHGLGVDFSNASRTLGSRPSWLVEFTPGPWFARSGVVSGRDGKQDGDHPILNRAFQDDIERMPVVA